MNNKVIDVEGIIINTKNYLSNQIYLSLNIKNRRNIIPLFS